MKPLIILSLVILGLCSQPVLSSAEIKQGHICLVGLMSELGLNQKELKVISAYDSEIIRLKSASNYEYECFLDGNQVLWKAYPGGRWRLNYSRGDTKIIWRKSKNRITISRHHSDGSSSSINYNL